MVDPPSTDRDRDRGLAATRGDGPGGDTTAFAPSESTQADSGVTRDGAVADRTVGDVARSEGHAGPSIAGYEILGELGRGGMGVVYHARQVRLNRPCALKMILAGAHADEVASVRFLAEAEAVARLQHANVVQIHHIGEAEGLPFFELEYVEGGSLDRSLDGTPWPARRAAGLVEAIARGVAEAHRLGIVHRDLKPANILIAADGTPKVADFGLAKSLAVDSGLTRTESILGSPCYMAPEQAEGRTKQVGPLADVYSLGAILYELLTGRPPFRGASILETLEQVKNAEPVPPSRLVPGLPRDLETIALKALQKEPAKRYASAAAVAEDLRRFGTGEPILARRSGPVERTWRWCRRKPVVAGLTASVGLLIVALIVWAFVYADEQRRLAVEKSALADDRTAFASEQVESGKRMRSDLYRTLLGRATAVRQARSPGYRRAVWADLREAAALDVPGKNPGEVLDEVVACLGDPIGLEAAPPAPITWPRKVPVELPAPYRDRGGIIAVSDGGLFALTDWSPSGDEAGPGVALGTAEGRILRRRKSPANVVHALRFTPDGSKLVAACEEGIVVWTAPDLEPWATFVGDSVVALTIHPAGSLMASMSQRGRTELWSLATNRLLASFQPPDGTSDLEFSNDGRYLLAIPRGGGPALAAWPIRDTAERRALVGHRSAVPTLAFSPDGRLLASGSHDRTLKVWEARTGALLASHEGLTGVVNGVAFSPDGALLASSDWRGFVEIRAPPAGEVLARSRMPEGHSHIWNIAFDPAGRYLVAQAEDWLAVWVVRRGPGGVAMDPLSSSPIEGSIALAVHPTGSSMAILGRSGQVLRYDPERGRFATIPGLEAAPSLGGIAFDPAGDRLLFITKDGKVGFWGWREGIALDPFRPAREAGRLVRPSPDGRWLAIQAGTGRAGILDATTGRDLVTLPPEPGAIGCAAWSPDGSRLALGVSDGSLAIWDLEQVRARAAEFGIDLASTASRRPGPAPSPPVEGAGGEGLAESARGRKAARETLAARVDEAATRGDWTRAAEAQEALADSATDDHSIWYRAVVFRAWAGDREAYRRSCRRALDRFGGTTDPMIAERLAKACLLLPTDGPETEEAVRLAERALAQVGESWLLPWIQFVVGLAESRSRNPQAALRRVDQSLANPNTRQWPVLRAQDYFLRAQALARLGRLDEARAALASGLGEATPSPLDGRPVLDGWQDMAISQILLREAELALLDAAFPPDPFGRPRPR